MTEHFGTRFPQFYITMPTPCPYLEGRQEKKVFTHLLGENAVELNNALTHGGFRRSQNIAYRPACDGCEACVSVRIRAGEFRPNRGFRKIMSRNNDLAVAEVAARASDEQYELLRAYLDERHPGGGMADMTAADYRSMVEDTTVQTRLIEYRFPPSEGAGPGRLVAAALTDWLDDGLSMVYSFFDPAPEGRSLGTLMVLDHIRRAQAYGLDYVYLGYWVDGCRKMAYKARFAPIEGLTPDGWLPLERD